MVSVVVYTLQIIIFRDSRNTLFYLLQDMAFVPIQVVAVSMVLDRILSKREKREKLEKINIVISAFFTDIGTGAIKELSCFNSNFKNFKKNLDIDESWTFDQIKNSSKTVKDFSFEFDSRSGNLQRLRGFLLEKKAYLLSMFENPNLLEHDYFTEMLWAVAHLEDELENREQLTDLPHGDLEHLSLDMERAYRLLVVEWLYYMDYLKREYPYLFSLALRKSPFSDKNSVIIQ